MPTLSAPTQGSFTPADLSAAPSLDQAFDVYDRKMDGYVDATEA